MKAGGPSALRTARALRRQPVGVDGFSAIVAGETTLSTCINKIWLLGDGKPAAREQIARAKPRQERPFCGRPF
jgi:hypothetical protein